LVAGYPVIAVIDVIVLLTLLLATPATAEGISGTARVIDGDTIEVQGVDIRLHGIDAPEMAQSCKTAQGGTWPCGKRSGEHLQSLIGSGAVSCTWSEVDAYGRAIGICRAGNLTLNPRMVSDGYAWAFRKYSTDYVEEEAHAVREKVGIWQGPAVPAWEYRDQRWASASNEAPEGCPIKGNINSDGERIYHAPWSKSYSRTSINTSKGERWFCSEEEAIGAGWRAPRN